MEPGDAFARIIRWVMRDTTFFKVYGATVEVDHGDSVDLTPDDPEMRGLGLTRVPKGAGELADSCLVQPGLRCLFGFRNGDPAKPIVRAWEYKRGSAHVILDGGGSPVARVGDLIKVLTLPALPVVGVIGGITQNPNPSPPPATIDVVVPAGTPLTLAVATIAVPVNGVISKGAARVRA